MVAPTPDLYVSKSSLSEWFRCPQSWFAKYPLGIRTPGSLLPARGNVLHSGILGGILAGRGTFEHALELANADPDYGVIHAAGTDEELMCEAVLLASSEVFADLRLSDKIILHEEKLTRDNMVNGKLVRYTIKCDAVLSDGAPYVFELKTTKSYINSQYWEKAYIDRQNWFYQDELKNQHNHDIEKLCWQVVKLPTQKKYRYSESGKKPSEYRRDLADELKSNTSMWFPFQEYAYDDKQVKRFRSDLDSAVKMQLHAIENNYFPRNTGSCFDFQRRCEFFPVCHENESYNNTELYQLRKDR